MNSNLKTSIVLGLLLAGLAHTALANVGPPVKVVLKGDPRGVAAGEVFDGTLEIRTETQAELTGFRFEGADWKVESMAVMRNKAMRAGESLEIPFAVRAQHKTGKLEFKFEHDGFTVTKMLDLSAEHAARMIDGAVTREVPVLYGNPADPSLQPAKPLLLESANKTTSQDDSETLPASAMRTITISGRFIFEDRRWDTQGADGLTVRVYDEDPVYDDHLGTTITGPFGYFSIDVSTSSSGETNPDIYLTFDAANSVTQLQDATWEINYSWKTGTWNSYSESDLDIGWRMTGNEREHAGLNILTNVVRTWRWLQNNEGYDTASVDVQWPDGSSSAWYNSFWEEIHISTEHEWNEGTISHEYGHHWVNMYANSVDPDYCNGICDPSSCSHCRFCEEDTRIAFSEGFPNWFADVVTRSYLQTYGVEPYGPRSQENLDTCQEDNLWADPLLTEGFFGALLRDIEDSDQDDHDHYPGYADVMAWGTHEIFDIIDGQHPTSVMAFIEGFHDTYPSTYEVLWETAKNCGYEIDEATPGAPTNLLSTHAVGVSSPDPTVEFGWYPAPDDAAGIAGYGIYLMGAAGLPGPTMDIGDVNDYVTEPLSPGTYYFNLRAVDRSGKWSTTYATYGPVIIRPTEPCDLTSQKPASWDYPLVPRNSATASSGDTHVSPLLDGNLHTTYWNYYGANNGESAASDRVEVRLYVDDIHRSSRSWSVVNANSGFVTNNAGPNTVRGGRHTFAAVVDAADLIPETNETNNHTGHQFIWTPLPLTANVPVVRAAPPIRDAGWNSVVDGSAKWYNCDGLATVTQGWWNAVAIYPVDLTEDYDVRLHEYTTGPENGFTTNLGYSGRPAGCLDAVLFNKNVTNLENFNAGVLNALGHTGDYVAEHVTSTGMAFDDSVNVTFSASDFLILKEFEVAATDTGYVSITVDIDPSAGPVYVQWRDQYFATGSLTSPNLEAVTDPVTGRARLDFHVTTTGYNGLALYRDPKNGSAALTATVEIEQTLPDVLAYQPAGWSAPVVPRAANDGTPSLVAAPDTLLGNVNATSLNMAIRNDSPTASPSVLGRIHLDGVYTWWLRWSGVPAYDTRYLNDSSTKTVRGGRHTLDLRLDSLHEFEESNEDNNIYGVQHVWSPLDVAMGMTVSRLMPPDRTGGWDTVVLNDTRWYNCDGLRIPAKTAWWQAVAVMPGAGSDVDLRLHPKLVGAEDGFAANLAYSGWGPESSDFLLVNYNLSPEVGYDVGVLNVDGNAPYTAQHTDPTVTRFNPSGPTAGYDIPAGAIVNLHELNLTVDQLSVRLYDDGGGVDWGISLMPMDKEFMSKSNAIAASWTAPAGGSEAIVDAPTVADGYYCLVVWKAKSDDLERDGNYHLFYGDAVSDVPEPNLPSATALRGIYPNPFNPQTTITFDLARVAKTEISIYDLRGSLVKTLKNGLLEAGRHQVVWQGTNNQGQKVASGVYMARMRADGFSQMKKLMLVK